MERYWHVGGSDGWRGPQLFPRSTGPFIRAARDSIAPERELVFGQWGLIPWFAKAAKLPYATVNSRFEEITTKASFRDPWKHGKRCVIPATSFDEPCWETGRGDFVAPTARLGAWRVCGHLGRQVQRRGGRVVHHAHAQCRWASLDVTHAQA